MTPFSFLASLIPPLPSLPFPSIPQLLQRRLLSFLLRKSVGHFVKGGLDAEAIEADLGRGSVRVQGLELEPDAITPLLAGLPVSFETGTIGSVAVQVTWPLSLASALSIQVEDLEIVLKVVPPEGSPSSTVDPSNPTSLFDSTSTISRPLPPPSVPVSRSSSSDSDRTIPQNLADSIISVAVASEFVKEELTPLEDAQLRRSLHLSESSASHSQFAAPLPGAFGGAPPSKEDKEVEGVEVTMLAGLIDRILARLGVRVKRIRIIIVHEDEGGAKSEVMLRVGEIVYADEKGTEGTGTTKLDPTSMDMLRSITISKPEILIRTSVPDKEDTESTGYSSSGSDDNASDQVDPMAMSIADLRTSSLSSAFGGKSMYESAISSSSSRVEIPSLAPGLQPKDDDSPFFDPDAEPESNPEADSGLTEDDFETIVSIGEESVVVVLSTPKVPPPEDPNPSSSPPRLPRPQFKIHSSINGPLAVLLRPHHIEAFIRVFTSIRCFESIPSVTSAAAPPAPSSDFTASVTIKTICLVLVYDDTLPRSRQDLSAFWARPSTFSLPTNHLRLRLDSLGAALSQLSNDSQILLPVRSFLLTETFQLGNEWCTLPILLSDPNVAKQYDLKDPKGAFPVFESGDWIENWKNGETKGWKVRAKVKNPPGRRDSTVVPAFSLTVLDKQRILEISPIHVFVDLSLVERLSPLLTLLLSSLAETPSPNINATGNTNTLSIPSTPSTPRYRSIPPPSAVLVESPELPVFEIRCILIRVELRCPPPLPLTKSHRASRRNTIVSTRSGILIADVHAIRMEVGKVGSRKEGFRVAWERSLFFFVPAQTTQALAFLSLSALAHDGAAITPSVHIQQIPSPVNLSLSRDSLLNPTSHGTTYLICEIPLVRISLDKLVSDHLQLFADDVGQWSQRAFSEGEDQSGRSERVSPKLVGSRFFGAKSFSRARTSVSSESGASEGESALTVKVVVTDTILDLSVPMAKPQGEETARQMRAVVSDLELRLDSLRNNENELRLEASILDIKLEDLSASSTIFTRTLSWDPSNAPVPILKLNFNSSTEKETGLKESKVQIKLSNFTFYVNANFDWLLDIASFAKAPAGAFETVVPNELTRLRLGISDGSIHITPPNLSSRLVLSIGDARVSTNIMPDLPGARATIELRQVRALAIESKGDYKDPQSGSASGIEHWKARGFVQLLDLESSHLQTRQANGLTLPEFELLVNSSRLNISVCADSVATIGAVFADFNAQPVEFKAPLISPPLMEDDQYASDLLGSVDPMAFIDAKTIDELPEILDDDVPSNAAYLAGSSSSTGHFRPGIPRRRGSGVVLEGLGQVISEINGETIRMLDPRGLQIIDDYLTVPRIDPTQDPDNLPQSLTRIRLTDVAVTIHLHDGYDWHITRKVIEDEAKAVRRKLEKIRQLLYSGQTPDATAAEETSALLFESVQLGLPPGASELPTGELLAAINHELEQASDAGGSEATSAWQPIAGSSASAARKRTLVGKARKRLTRSRTHAIEVNLRGMKLNFDAYPATNLIASRLRIDVGSFDIIDNIQTSTWRKFLTELRPSDGGIVRESGAAMVRIELDKVRSSEEATEDDLDQEIALKIKVFPLRLYIDQDALDFLRAFGAFKLPPSAASTSSSSNAVEPYFKRCEVLPVKMKVDYKPKRVDYKALRRGKTAEMMNFFHFDGSEMTLRHLVVTGVSGANRLSDLVQDIWTPDVKANQLSDVISGIAPIKSVVNVGSGFANLILLPIEQYRKDGKIARGIQKGISNFNKTATLEALSVGARLATGTQVILEHVEKVLGGRFVEDLVTEASGSQGTGEFVGIETMSDEERVELISRYAEQPGDLREGVEKAYKSLGDNLRSAAQTILAVPMDVYERSGSEGLTGRVVLRAVPIAVLRPMIGATEAVSKTLLGLRNDLDPDAQVEASDKYKRHSVPQPPPSPPPPDS